MRSRSKTIAGRRVSARVGSRIVLEVSQRRGTLLPCDWDEADFRLSSSIIPDGVACNVHVTGRTMNKLVRCQVEFVGDGEPNKVVPGWLYAETARVEYLPRLPADPMGFHGSLPSGEVF